MLILDRTLDLQTPMTFDYSYSSALFETIDIPPDLQIDDLKCLKSTKKAQSAEKKEEGVAQANYLDNTDFVWSKYKCCHVAEALQMIQFEIRKLAELQTCITKKSKPKKKAAPDVQ